MKSALMIIDIQVGLVELVPSELQNSVLSNVTRLLGKARGSGLPIFFIQHDGPKGHPLEVETSRWKIHPLILPRNGELVIRKKASDSFFETELAEHLQRGEIRHLIIVGGMSEYCVDTTCRRAVTLGYDVMLAADAHLTSDSPDLKASQIIAHHNRLLDGFAAGGHFIKVVPTAEIYI